MNRDQIEKWAREADQHADKGYTTLAKALVFRDTRWHAARDEHFARLVRAAALEEGAAVCDDMVRRTYSNTAVLIAAAENIRARKEPQP